MGKKLYFFGWQNIKRGITEVIKIYSNVPSFFSKKRIESAIAFIVAQCGMVYFLVTNVSTMSASDMGIWAGIEFAVAGYIVYQIQKEKKDGTSSDTDKTTGEDTTPKD